MACDAGPATAGQPRPRLAALRRAGGALFSFEACFLAFMFAGNYKAAKALSWVPVDMTIVTLLLSGLVGLFVVWRRWREERPPKQAPESRRPC